MFKTILASFLLGILWLPRHGQAQDTLSGVKINGISLVSENRFIDSSHVLPMKEVGANWVAVIPFAFMPESKGPELVFDLDWQWKGERLEGIRNQVQEVHNQGMSAMIKPQIWVEHGIFTGEIEMSSEEDWISLEENYRKYIRAFAELAEEEKVEMICIGTELQFFVEQRVPYWRKLIAELRSIYSGKLTYAANWDEFDDVAIWDDLDFIGVDAYFPIANKARTSIKQIKKNWIPYIELMDSVADKFDRPYLFTEFGYRSINGCGIKPWEYEKSEISNEKEQRNALKALFEVFWKRDHFAGGFLWKWHPNHVESGGQHDTMYTVQNKLSEEVVKHYYSNY